MLGTLTKEQRQISECVPATAWVTSQPGAPPRATAIGIASGGRPTNRAVLGSPPV